jgi:D-sedoheptulose 7-phosphate isomerase
MGLETEYKDHIAAVEGTVRACAGVIDRIVIALCACFREEGKVLLCGNGGSAADAQHLAAEFVNRFRMDRGALPALALTTDSSVLTCVSNDDSFEKVFSRQVQALGRAGDVLVVFSTSGLSANILAAACTARVMGLVTVGLTGEGGQETMAPVCDLLVVVPSGDCARIQECHEFVGHAVVGMVEDRLFGGAGS